MEARVCLAQTNRSEEQRPVLLLRKWRRRLGHERVFFWLVVLHGQLVRVRNQYGFEGSEGGGVVCGHSPQVTPNGKTSRLRVCCRQMRFQMRPLVVALFFASVALAQTPAA